MDTDIECILGNIKYRLIKILLYGAYGKWEKLLSFPYGIPQALKGLGVGVGKGLIILYVRD